MVEHFPKILASEKKPPPPRITLLLFRRRVLASHLRDIPQCMHTWVGHDKRQHVSGLKRQSQLL